MGQRYRQVCTFHCTLLLLHHFVYEILCNIFYRASDKKIKLEIALKEATEFHDALQAFVDWLTNAEKVLSGAKPVSRVMETILSQLIFD